MNIMIEIPRWLLYVMVFCTGWALQDMYKMLKRWWRSR